MDSKKQRCEQTLMFALQAKHLELVEVRRCSVRLPNGPYGLRFVRTAWN
jgi:hypothetical protein